jgi:DNA-binding LytR/AlgR family response regulator
MSDTFITVKIKGRYLTLKQESIIFLKASGCYTWAIFNEDENKQLITRSVSSLSHYLNKNFLRCHRSFIVNIHKITSFDSKTKTLILRSHKIPFSKRKSSEIFRYLSESGIPDTEL